MTAALALVLTTLAWLPWTAYTVGSVFDGLDYLLAYGILMGLALPCASCWPERRGSSPAASTYPWCLWPPWRP